MVEADRAGHAALNKVPKGLLSDENCDLSHPRLCWLEAGMGERRQAQNGLPQPHPGRRESPSILP